MPSPSWPVWIGGLRVTVVVPVERDEILRGLCCRKAPTRSKAPASVCALQLVCSNKVLKFSTSWHPAISSMVQSKFSENDPPPTGETDHTLMPTRATLTPGAGTFLSLSLELSFDVTPAESEDMKAATAALCCTVNVLRSIAWRCMPGPSQQLATPTERQSEQVFWVGWCSHIFS